MQIESRPTRIRQRRHNLNFATQEDLAKAAGVSARTIASLESETEQKESFQTAKLAKVARTLNWTVQEMMDGHTTYPPNRPQHHTLNELQDAATVNAALDTLRGQAELMIQQIDQVKRQLQPPANSTPASAAAEAGEIVDDHEARGRKP